MRFPLCLAPTILALALVAGCKAPGAYPSLAPRAAEAIDPRIPIPANPSPGSVDPRIGAALAQAVARARAGRAAFDRLAQPAEALAAAAGPKQSEGWIAAVQALSALTAQHGVTTAAAADVDAIGAEEIDARQWLVPATQAAIAAAAAEIGAISTTQSGVLQRLGARLGV